MAKNNCYCVKNCNADVYLNGIDGEKKLESSDLDGKDGGALKIMSKISVFPVLNLRIVGRIF